MVSAFQPKVKKGSDLQSEPQEKKILGFFVFIKFLFYICGMNKYQLSFYHPKFGELTIPSFNDQTQFRIFCKMVQGALALKTDLTTYDAQEMFIHIPYSVLVESVIVSKINGMTLAEYAMTKTEMLVNN